MKKDKDSRAKREAFMSFLEAPTTPATSDENSSKIQKKAASDNEHQQYEEVYLNNQSCVVCSKEMNPSSKKTCGFCGQSACADHLRKRRKRKNKWERVCENCEDHYLFDAYMRVEIKAEEALGVEEEIVGMKHQEIEEMRQTKLEKRRDITFKADQLNNKFNTVMKELENEENKLMSKEHQVEGLQLQTRQLEEYIKRLESRNVTNFEQDFGFLTQEDEKLRKELTSLGKRCEEVRTTIDRKQKELEDAYQHWEQNQYRKSIIEESPKKDNKKSKDCQIY